MPICTKCGTQNQDMMNFCSYCGNSMNQTFTNDIYPQEKIDDNVISYIVAGCAFVLCVFFFVPLMEASIWGRHVTISGWNIAASTGPLEGRGASPLVLALIIIPAILLILAFTKSSFIVLRNVSIVGLIAKIIFLIWMHQEDNGAYLTGINWLIMLVYAGLAGFMQYCLREEETTEKSLEMIKIAKKHEARERALAKEEVKKAKEEMKSFTDSRDGKTYKTIKIGNQTWMAENLNYAAEGSKCYNNDPSNCQKYGRLYDWSTAKEACPSGWHLPSKDEWEVLTNALGGEEVAGKKLKAESGWDNYYGTSGNGTDDCGFSALPGGCGYSNGNFGGVGNRSHWWSASESESNSDNACRQDMYHDIEGTSWDNSSKSGLFSVRCVQD